MTKKVKEILQEVFIVLFFLGSAFGSIYLLFETLSFLFNNGY